MRATQPHTNTDHTHHKKTPSLFSCAFFRHCTETPLSPTTPGLPPPSIPPQPSLPPLQLSNNILPSPPSLPPPHHQTKISESESSSSSTSQSFTQWGFPHPPPPLQPPPGGPGKDGSPEFSDLVEVFHTAEVLFTSGLDSDRLKALHLLEHSLVPNPPSDGVPESGATVVVPAVVVNGVVQHINQPTSAKSATKVLLALCLAEGNRRAAVECGVPTRVLDALPDVHGSVAERALAALELMCTVSDGAAEVRAHALAVPMLVATMGKMEGRGREYAISVLTAVYGGGGGEDHQVWKAAPPEEVARAVVLAMQQGDCSARGKRKGAQLLKVLQENGMVDLTQ